MSIISWLPNPDTSTSKGRLRSFRKSLIFVTLWSTYVFYIELLPSTELSEQCDVSMFCVDRHLGTGEWKPEVDSITLRLTFREGATHWTWSLSIPPGCLQTVSSQDLPVSTSTVLGGMNTVAMAGFLRGCCLILYGRYFLPTWPSPQFLLPFSFMTSDSFGLLVSRLNGNKKA